MQADGLAGREVQHDRAGVAAERRAVVQEHASTGRYHLTGRQPLPVVHVAEDGLDEGAVGNPAVARGVANHRHLLQGLWHPVGQANRGRQPAGTG